MQVTKYWVVALIVMATTSRSAIVIGGKATHGSIQELAPALRDLVYIVTSCYGDNVDAVGLAGNLPDNFIRTLAEHSIPVALIDDAARSLDPSRRLDVQFQHRLRVFIVGVSSVDHLSYIMSANHEFAIWWDHTASYFILDSSPDCLNIMAFLKTAWVYTILDAKVICHPSRAGKTIISNFNPFTCKAPVSWGQPYVFRAENTHPFTVFDQNFRKNKAICVDLDFDKTTDLNGYEFRVYGYRPNFHSLNRKRNLFSYNFFATNDRIMQSVLDVLHVKVKFMGYSSKSSYSHEANIHFNPMAINFELSSDLITYPHAMSAFVIVTKFRGHKSQLNKILTVIDINSRYGMGVVYLITLIFLKIFVHQTLVPALLNLVRITCNTGLSNLPNNTAPRIYLTSLLFFVVTMQGIYQGNLATLLTTKIPVRNVNTMQDLVDLGYEKIYSTNSVENIIEHPYIREHFIYAKNYFDCINLVANDSSAACIIMTDGVLDLAAKAKLHVGTKFVEPLYISFPTHDNWPLKGKVDKIISRMFESSVLEPWDVKCSPAKFTDFEFDDEVKANVDFKNIEINEVSFTFVILGIGHVCATITFIIELVVHYLKSRTANVRVQILN